MNTTALLIYCLGLAFGVYMLIRNEWVFRQRCRFAGTIQYNRLPSYTEMLRRFWIWDIEKFMKMNATNVADFTDALERIVEELSNRQRGAGRHKWHWTRVMSNRDAADEFLALLAHEGLIEQRKHPYGGQVWRVNGKLFGRADGMTHEKFDALSS